MRDVTSAAAAAVAYAGRVKLAASSLLALLVLGCGPSTPAATGPASAPLALATTAPALGPTDPAPATEPAPEPAPPPEPATVEFVDNRIVPSRPVTYATGAADVTPDGDVVLAAVAAFLASKETMTQVRIEVHTDAQGSDDANQALSEARAVAAARALIRHGVACERLLPVGFGETKPIADNRTAEGRAQNRRTEFAPVALRGKVIGGLPPDGGGRIAGDACAL